VVHALVFGGLALLGDFMVVRDYAASLAPDPALARPIEGEEP
jgi:hypothetical protein